MSRRRRRKSRETWITALVLVGASGAAWWVYHRISSATPIESKWELGVTAPIVQERPAEPQSGKDEPQPSSATNQPVTQPTQAPPASADSTKPDENVKPSEPTVSDKPAEPVVTPKTVEVAKPASPDSIESLLNKGKEALDKSDWLTARNIYVDASKRELTSAQRILVREKLAHIAQETIFSSRITPNDPLVDRYVVQAGDHLERVAVAHKITVDLIARTNALPDRNMIRIGQTLKVIKGPFRAVVNKNEYTLDVYLGDVFLKELKVGLGADDSTPTGEWVVVNKLRNPRYYPPRGGKVIDADDPKNPLGEFWIGLEGTKGEALGQQRYGIHGTIEPDTIGQCASMGCVRLGDADIEALYAYLVERHSTVTVNGAVSQAAAQATGSVAASP